MTDKPEVKITELSLVSAPRCDGCGEPMVKHDATRWICNRDECDQNTTPVQVDGVYPFTVVKPPKRLCCTTCGAEVSTAVPGDVVVRAAITCPECVQAEADVEAELTAIRERWQKLEEKVAQAMGHATVAREAREAELVMKAQGLKVAGCKEYAQASGEMLLQVDEVRRAYAIFDALRSVQIWMKGYL
jgi:hypothetical protein